VVDDLLRRVKEYDGPVVLVSKPRLIRRALAMMSSSGLDVRFVSYGTPSREILQIAKDFA
jgi:hypothetical protein